MQTILEQTIVIFSGSIKRTSENGEDKEPLFPHPFYVEMSFPFIKLEIGKNVRVRSNADLTETEEPYTNIIKGFDLFEFKGKKCYFIWTKSSYYIGTSNVDFEI